MTKCMKNFIIVANTKERSKKQNNLSDQTGYLLFKFPPSEVVHLPNDMVFSSFDIRR